MKGESYFRELDQKFGAAEDRRKKARADDNSIGYREWMALRLCEREGVLYVGGYGMLFEAAMVCEKLGLLEQGGRASRLTLTPKGRGVLAQAGPEMKEDGWTLEVAT